MRSFISNQTHVNSCKWTEENTVGVCLPSGSLSLTFPVLMSWTTTDQTNQVTHVPQRHSTSAWEWAWACVSQLKNWAQYCSLHSLDAILCCHIHPELCWWRFVNLLNYFTNLLTRHGQTNRTTSCFNISYHRASYFQSFLFSTSVRFPLGILRLLHHWLWL